MIKHFRFFVKVFTNFSTSLLNEKVFKPSQTVWTKTYVSDAAAEATFEFYSFRLESF